MYIENIKIGSFGKLSNREIELFSGVNVIEGNNESGKTTLSEFIKFVFYGLSNKNSDGEMSERKRHISWKTNDVSGSIVINTEKGRFRIERSMVPHSAGYKDNITVVDLSNNAVITGIKNPGEYFFGIPEEVFTKTVYVRQAEGAYFNGESIGQAVENIFYSADESVNTDKALKKLDEARVGIKHKKNTGRGQLVQLEQERDSLVSRLAEARIANEQILQTESSLRHSLQSIEKNKKDCEKMSRQLRKIEVFNLLKKFDERKTYLQKYEKYTAGKAEIIEKTSYNGFFPEPNYRDELKEAKTELEYLKKDVEKFESDNGFEPDGEYSVTVAEKIREYGGRNGIKTLLAKLSSRKKNIGVCAGLLLGASIACGALGVFIEKLLLLGALVFALACIFCFALSVAAKGRITKIFEDFGVSTEEELFATVQRTEQAESARIRNRELMKFKEQNKENALQKLSVYIQKVGDILGKWGITLDREDYKTVISCLCDTLSDLEEIGNAIKDYDEKINTTQAVISHIDSDMAVYNEQQLRNEYASIEEDADSENADDIRRKYDFTSKAIESLREKVSELEKNLAALKARTDRPSEIETRLNAVNEVIKDLTYKHDAYVLAYEKLQEAGVSLRGKLAPGLSKASGRYMSGLTDGKYKDIGVSDSLSMTYSFEENGTDYTKEIDNLSSGTRDIAYVSLRLALAELFCRSGEGLPVVFDESFARLDDGRLKNMLKIALNYSENGSQSIILTSQTREAVLMGDVGGNDSFRHIYM